MLFLTPSCHSLNILFVFPLLLKLQLPLSQLWKRGHHLSTWHDSRHIYIHVVLPSERSLVFPQYIPLLPVYHSSDDTFYTLPEFKIWYSLVGPQRQLPTLPFPAIGPMGLIRTQSMSLQNSCGSLHIKKNPSFIYPLAQALQKYMQDSSQSHSPELLLLLQKKKDPR